MHVRHLSLILFLLWFATPPLAAQNIDYEGLASLFGEPVTAGATGKPQRLSEVPVSMEIITRQQIRDSGARDVPELLRRFAGIEVQRTFQGHADLSIRGYNQFLSNRTLVLINGHQVYLDVYGTVFWHSFPINLSDLEQVELVRGPASSLYGFNAELGVINLVTRDPLKQKETRITAEFQEPQGHRLESSIPWHAGDRMALRFSAGIERADGFDNQGTPGDPIPFDDALDRTAFSVEGHWLANPSTSLRFQVGYNDLATDLLGPGAARGQQLTEQTFLDLTLSNDSPMGLWQVDVQVNNNEVGFKTTRFQGTQDVPPLDSEFRRIALANLFSLSAQNVVRMEGEIRRSAVQYATPDSIFDSELALHTLSFSAMWHHQRNSKISFNNSVRADRWDTSRFQGLNAFDPVLPVNDAPPPDGSEISFTSAFNWQWTPRRNLRLSLSHGHHIPSLIELSQNFRFPQNEAYGNPLLVPESLTQVEASLNQKFGDGASYFRLNAFYGEGRDLIEVAVFLPVPGQNILPDFSFINSADTEHYGIEAELFWQPEQSPWTVRLNTTWMELEDTPISPFPGFNRLEDNQINHRANLTVDYRHHNSLLQGEVYWVDGNEFTATSLNFPPVLQKTQDAYTVLNLHAHQRLGRQWRLRFSGYNLLERHQEVPTLTFVTGITSGGVELDRAFRLTCTYSF
ncbi:TonB-dependent receptor plug domain-containing protein [Acanthopleuribacter pedis]|uniref:TonB-dependent receptor n=1 Tax=Acanthopleuribacter pedis TaxID=442870 RepID=A0A8J7U5U3_9BACT|nr:TonB-dependent receptor [Acanthopleuribacter pedis]MBO1320833.1 TonB-dependent receptor [Acanthopleuribacter pedis]